MALRWANARPAPAGESASAGHPPKGVCDNPAYAVVPIPQSRERSESWTPMVRSESDLKSENLAVSILKAVRDSSSSATKEWRTSRNDRHTTVITQTPKGERTTTSSRYFASLAGAGRAGLLPSKALNNSTGIGNTIVVFFSVPISAKVWR